MARGLVDGMSSFGVKGPIRRLIITDNFFYTTAADLVAKLLIHMNNANYYYKTVDSSSFRRLRKNREELVIAGCRKTRMLSFFPNGSVQKKRHMCSCESCLQGEFEECVLDAGDSKVIYEDGVDESDSDSEDIALRVNLILKQ